MSELDKWKFPGLEEYAKPIQGLYNYINAQTGMDKAGFMRLAVYCQVRKFDKKTIILKPGEVDQYFNLIMKGVARKYIFAGKREITLQLSTEGHFIHSELSFFTGNPSDCYIETIEPTTLLSLRSDHMNQLFEEVPEYNKLARLMAGEMYVRKELRDLAHLRLSAKDRFLQYVTRHPGMLQRVSQKYIASYLHIKPETFSRLKHLLKENP